MLTKNYDEIVACPAVELQLEKALFENYRNADIQHNARSSYSS